MGRSVNFNFKTVTVAASGTPVAFSATRIPTTRIEVFVPASNTGSVYVGNSAVTVSSIPRATSTTTVFIASENASLGNGDYFLLDELFLDADNNDDVAIIQYIVAEGGV